jgi:hypothetical protein
MIVEFPFCSVSARLAALDMEALPHDLLVAVLRKLCVRDIARMGCTHHSSERWLGAVRQLLAEARAAGLGDLVEVSTESLTHRLARWMGVGWSMPLEFVKKVFRTANKYRCGLSFEFAALEKLHVACKDGDAALLDKVVNAVVDHFSHCERSLRASPYDCLHVRLEHIDGALLSLSRIGPLPVWAAMVAAADVEDGDSDPEYMASEHGSSDEDEEEPRDFAVVAPEGSNHGGVALASYSTREDFLEEQMNEEHAIPPSVLMALPQHMQLRVHSPNDILDFYDYHTSACSSQHCCHQRCWCLVLKESPAADTTPAEFHRALRSLPSRYIRRGHVERTGATACLCAAAVLDRKLARAHRSCLRFLNEGWGACMEVVAAERAANPGEFVQVMEPHTCSVSRMIAGARKKKEKKKGSPTTYDAP